MCGVLSPYCTNGDAAGVHRSRAPGRLHRRQQRAVGRHDCSRGNERPDGAHRHSVQQHERHHRARLQRWHQQARCSRPRRRRASVCRHLFQCPVRPGAVQRARCVDRNGDRGGGVRRRCRRDGRIREQPGGERRSRRGRGVGAFRRGRHRAADGHGGGDVLQRPGDRQRDAVRRLGRHSDVRQSERHDRHRLGRQYHGNQHGLRGQRSEHQSGAGQRRVHHQHRRTGRQR